MLILSGIRAVRWTLFRSSSYNTKLDVANVAALSRQRRAGAHGKFIDF